MADQVRLRHADNAVKPSTEGHISEASKWIIAVVQHEDCQAFAAAEQQICSGRRVFKKGGN
jgi:hypothetical protein